MERSQNAGPVRDRIPSRGAASLLRNFEEAVMERIVKYLSRKIRKPDCNRFCYFMWSHSSTTGSRLATTPRSPMTHPNKTAVEYLDMETLHLHGNGFRPRRKQHPASGPMNRLVRKCGEVGAGETSGAVRRGRVPGCAGRRDRRSSLQHSSPGPHKTRSFVQPYVQRSIR